MKTPRQRRKKHHHHADAGGITIDIEIDIDVTKEKKAMLNGISPDIWSKEFTDNQIDFIADLSRSVSTMPSVTYQQLDDALRAAIVKYNLDVGILSIDEFNYQYGEVHPFAGPVTPQCCFQCINNGMTLFSGVELWLASTPDSPGTPHAAMIGVVVNELVALTKGISE